MIGGVASGRSQKCTPHTKIYKEKVFEMPEELAKQGSGSQTISFGAKSS